MSFVSASLVQPTTDTIPRLPTSARRTSHIDMLFDDRTPGTLGLRGRARDLTTDWRERARGRGRGPRRCPSGRKQTTGVAGDGAARPGMQGLLGLEVGRGFPRRPARHRLADER